MVATCMMLLRDNVHQVLKDNYKLNYAFVGLQTPFDGQIHLHVL